MMAGPGGGNAAGGGPARHIPVLLEEVLKVLAPLDGALIVDGTFGAGGYTRAMLAAGASVIGIDRDPDAIAAARPLEQASGGRLRLTQAPFSHLEEIAGEPVDGVVLDIGVSSMQLDEAERGFSFRLEGPLDMRMSQQGMSAADVVNNFSIGDLARVFGLLGEERHAGRLARAIARRRTERAFESTRDLAETIEATIGRKPGERIHPATRAFQGLRIFVNDELGELARALFAAERSLRPGGRLAVVTFHSLEDRIVKQFIADRSGQRGGSRHLPDIEAHKPTFSRAFSRPVVAGEAECAANPRARSAKLRAAIRTEAPAREENMVIFNLPEMPWPDEAKGR